MRIIEQSRTAIKRLVFGDTLLPQGFTIGVAGPQAEITVWLHGMDAPLDVTHRHSSACFQPFTICVAFDEGRVPDAQDLRRLSLKFCEREGQKRVLGEIGLRKTTAISMDGLELLLFEARSSANYCLQRRYLWAHYLLHAYSGWRSFDASEIKMSFRERRASMVTFIRPHPVSLVSLGDNSCGNIFPMNIMGDLGHDRFGFALRKARLASGLVERSGRIAVSCVPLPQAPFAYQLATNHLKEFIDWEQLPFATRLSSLFEIPVPVFALRVREMEIEKIQRIGSHTFFVARIVHNESFSDGLELCVIHGFYQAHRLKGRSAELKASVVQDSVNKQGLNCSQTPAAPGG
jgi:flavin reductase (DIM6/NTAB) family NADH-FMN oxidoreductase RutF